MYHVISRGGAGRAIFAEEDDKWGASILLDNVIYRFDLDCMSWCFLDTHYHLLVRTPDPNIGRAMHRFNGIYAQSYNERHGTRGHVFETRYWAWLIQSDEHLRNVARYIALNPIRARVCRSPEEWRWSSHRFVVNGQKSCVDERVLFAFYGGGAGGRAAYAAHVEEGLAQHVYAWPHAARALNGV
jgi:putative transposase